MRLARRMQQVQSPVIPVVGELIRSHPGTISLGQGVVHYGPPPEAFAHAARVGDDPANHKYQAVDGIAALQAAIATKLEGDNGLRLAADQRIVVTAGGNMAFMNAVLAIADPGDEIVLLSPYYFNHEMAIAMASCRAVVVPTDEQYQPDVAAVEAALTSRTRAVVTVSPNNPTGAVYPEAVLRAVNALCARRGVYHISDEAYEYFTYDGATHFSPGSIPGSAAHTISLYSLSKSYGFASWRIGYMVVPAPMLMPIKKAQDTILICPPVVCQHAAVGALSVGSGYCARHVARLAGVRRLVLDELAALGGFCTVPPATGAFYFLLRLDTALDAMALVRRLVSEFGVAAIPGGTFGIERGCFLRIAYGALQRETVATGIGRLVKGLRAIVGG